MEAVDAQILESKAKIMESKPLGMRLDACRAACQRAERRVEEAEKRLAEALAAKDEADSVLEQRRQDLAQLEATVASKGDDHMALEPQHEQVEQLLNSLRDMAGQLAATGADCTPAQVAQQLGSLLQEHSGGGAPAAPALDAHQRFARAPTGAFMPVRRLRRKTVPYARPEDDERAFSDGDLPQGAPAPPPRARRSPAAC